MFSKMGSNDLASLRKYLESSESNIYEYSKSIEYQYDVTPIIYSSDINNLRQINPDTSFSSLGMGSESTTNSLMSSMMSTDVFYQMPSDTKLFEDQYDIKAGKLPTNYNECVVVLTSSGNISDFMLYTLGLRDYSEFNNIINQFLAGKTAESPEYSENRYSYEDMLGITFKLINSSDRYEYDDEYKIWRDKSENTDYMKNVVENGEDLKIVGVIQPKEGATAPMLQAGIGYSASLTNYIIDKSYQSQIVKEQLVSPEINVFTGKRFDDTENDSSLDMSSLIEVDSNAIKSAFKIDQSKIKVDFSNMNNLINQTNLPELDINDIMSKLEFSISNDEMKDLMTEIMQGYNDYLDKYHPDANLNNISEKLLEYINSKEAQELIKQEVEKAIKENGKIEITQDQMKEIMTKVLDGFKEYAKENNIPDTTKLEEYLSEYLQSEEVKTIVSNRLTKIMQSQNLEKQISNIMNDYMKSAVTRS